MPKIADMDSVLSGASGFKFSTVGAGKLTENEYTLATIAVDLSGSVKVFKTLLEKALQTIYSALKRNPRKNNMLVRLIGFSEVFPDKGTCEIHGFKLLAEIDPATIQLPTPSGGTPLYDAFMNAVDSANKLAQELDAKDYLVNAVSIGVTDGADNASFFKPSRIAESLGEGVEEEYLESHLSIVIGINPDGWADSQQTRTNAQELEKFKTEGHINHYIKVDDATEGNLAKMAGFISQSVSSQSQALGSGGPSQAIAPTI